MVNTVVTYNGHTELRSDCVFIRGKYFHKERDCFFHEGLYYSPFSRYLVVDNESGDRVHLSAKSLSYGIIGTIEDDKPALGYFSQNIVKNGSLLLPSSMSTELMGTIVKDIDSVGRLESGDAGDFDITRLHRSSSSGESRRLENNRIVKCMDVRGFTSGKSTICGSRMKQALNSDCIYAADDAAIYKSLSKLAPKDISAAITYDFELAHNSEVMIGIFQKAYAKNRFPASPDTTLLRAILKNYTFGIEYETWNGRIPTCECGYAGMVPVKDGSLRHDGICGNEYATVIMNSDKGLDAIKYQCELLKKYAHFNERCSMHIHIGNIPKTEENLCRLYSALFAIQDSLYSLFPACLQNTNSYKGKDYCSRLPDIDVTADNIVSFLSGGGKRFKEFGQPHPQDSQMSSKWHIESRYKIFNINNFYFTPRGTIELRVSTSTFNHSKVVALLIVFSLIIDSALQPNTEYYKDILKLVEATMPSGDKKTWILNYIAYRKKVLSAYTIGDGGVKYFEEMSNDNLTGNANELY